MCQLKWILSNAIHALIDQGQPDVNCHLYPRHAFIYYPTAGTASFKIERGFNIRKMDNIEKVAVRLASFASNVEAVSNIPQRFPNPNEFRRAARTESVRHLNKAEDPKKLARKMLHLASKQTGLFYHVNSRQYQGNSNKKNNQNDIDDDDINKDKDSQLNDENYKDNDDHPALPAALDFWVVSEEERECFSRLACQEAMRAIDKIDAEEKKLKINP